MNVRKLTHAQYLIARKALDYADRGDPIKDAFTDPGQERDVIVDSLRVAVENFENVPD